MSIYELSANFIQKVKQTTFAEKGIFEKFDLQRLLCDAIDVIAEDCMVIAEEFGNWEESKRRIDLLCIDREANLVVVELKRTEDGGHMDLQAIRYAAMVSTTTFEAVVAAHAQFLHDRGRTEEAQQRILQFLDWEEPEYESFGREVRIVLVSSDFSKELTTAVLWLNDHKLDIRCVRVRPYELDSKTLLDVQQVIPLPEAADYIVRQKDKKAEEDSSKLKFNFDFSLFDLNVRDKVITGLTARRFILEVVRAVIQAGISPDKLTDVLSWGKRRWIKVPGELSEADFREQAAQLLSPMGVPYQLKRYFCKEDELFQVAGNTYALSNQSNHGNVQNAAATIQDTFPDLHLSFHKEQNDGA
jgi:hypothetical protein